MDVMLELRSTGKPSKELSHTVVRELEESDIALANEPGRGSLPTSHPTIARIRNSHHNIARLFANGEGLEQVSAVTGYTVARLSTLAQDPSMRGLIEFYRQNMDLANADLHDRLTSISMDAAEVLHERIIEDPEGVSTGHLIETVKMTADRTGFSPVSRSLNVNVNVGMADRLKAARERALAASRPLSKDEEAA